MKVYYYCSYTKSPVGFRLGMVDTDNACGETCEPSSEEIQPFIWKCFSQSSIRQAHGLIPQELEEPAQYFILMKSKVPIIKGEIEYFINFAFVTDQRTEYESWIQGGSQKETDPFHAIMETIVLNGSLEFGFTVCTEGLRTLKNKAYYSLPDRVPTSTESTYIDAVLSKNDASQLLSTLGLSEYDVHNLNQGNWFSIKKKLHTQFPWVIAAIAAAAVAALLLILSSLGKVSATSESIKEPAETTCVDPFANSSKPVLDTFPQNAQAVGEDLSDTIDLKSL